MRIEQLPYDASIGGHAIAAICGYSGPNGKTPIDIWEALTKSNQGQYTSDFKPTFESEKGKLLQPLILKHWAADNAIEHYEEEVAFQDDEYAYMTGHVDAIRHDLLIEVKTVNHRKASLFASGNIDGLPKNWIIQIQWYLWLTKLPRAVLLVNFFDTIKEYFLDADLELQLHLRKKAQVFWTEYVCKNVCPPPQTNQEVAKYYVSCSNDSAYMGCEHDFDFCAELKEIKQNIKQLEERQERLEFLIKNNMGNCENLVTADGQILATWKNSSTTRLDITALKKEMPEIYDQFVVTKQSRRFLIK